MLLTTPKLYKSLPVNYNKITKVRVKEGEQSTSSFNFELKSNHQIIFCFLLTLKVIIHLRVIILLI